jgi:hypothetical protein
MFILHMMPGAWRMVRQMDRQLLWQTRYEV